MIEYYANWPFDQQDTSDEAKKKLIDHIKKTNREIEDEVRNDGYFD